MEFREHEEDKVEMRFAVQPEPSALKVFEMDVTEEEMTQHTHPDWLNVVKKAITDDMALCSARTQQAVQNNEKIKVKTVLAWFGFKFPLYFRSPETISLFRTRF